MQTEARPNTNLSYLDDSDQEALGYFNNLHPDQQHQPEQPQSNHSPQMDEEENRPLGRLSKLKKQSKKLKKKLKKKQRKMQRQRKMKQLMQRGEPLQIATPQKKLKKMKRKTKDHESGSQSAKSQQAGSSEFSSQSQNEDDIHNELKNLNPDAQEDPSPTKRLKKSNRKSKIEDKQGFSINQLGNQAEIKTQKLKKYYDDDQDYSFDDVNKKGRKRKPKVSVPTNQQIMSNLKEHGGVVEDEGPQNQGNYDNGLDMLYAMKDKRKGAIKVNNKLFSNLDFDIQNQQAQMPPPQNLQLQLKPKTSNHSSSRFTFLSKVETLKKQRGLQANIDVQAYQKKIQQRAKQSMAKAVNVMSQQQFQDQIDLQVRVPTIARGKSADIINNTVFLKSFTRNKTEVPPESPLKQVASLKQTFKRQGISRQQFYKQIQEQTRLRRSKYISQQELKNSFKKTNLGQLEQARKRIQQKRRKQALSQNSQEEQNGELDSKQDKIQEMIQIQQRICGDIQEEDDAASEGEKAEDGLQQSGKKLEQAKFTITLQEEEPNAEQKQQLQGLQQEQEEQNQFDQLASASQHPQAQQQDEPEQDQEQAEEQEQPSEPPQQPKEQMQVEVMPDFKEEDRRQMMELEQEGITVRKRKIVEPSEVQPSSLHSQEEKQNEAVPVPTPKGKQLAEEQNEEFSNFRKLRKIAMVIAQKKKVREEGRKYASQFIEQQAQEGSDNEEHDDMIKNIDYKAEEKEYEGVDLDADLVQLIDNAVDINQEDQYQAFRKYLEDIRLKDREEIKKIIRGEFKSRHDDLELEVEQDERKRQERMEEVMNWMKRRQEEEGEGIYLKPAENEANNEDDSDSQMSYKKKKQVVEEQSQQIPEEEQKAMIQRFIENTLPSSKKQYRPIKVLDLGPLPQSVRLQKSSSNKTISLTKLGSKNSGQAKSAKVKKTSSLINQILNRNSISKISQKTLTGKFGKKL